MLVLAPTKKSGTAAASPKQTQGAFEIQKGQSLALSDRHSWKDFQENKSSLVELSGIKKVVWSLKERHISGNQS